METVIYCMEPRHRTGIQLKAIRDGNTSPRHIPVHGNVHPIKIENIDIFCDVITLLARVFYIFN